MVYVINQHGAPLMPCSTRKARLLLGSNKATVVHATPFTIKLRFGASGYRQPVTAALDTGSKVVGSAAVANGQVVYQAEVTLRNDITSKLKERATHRRTRRGRKTRYRPARFSNRSASCRKGRLAPSLRSKLDSHLREVRFIEHLLPVSQWIFELASFDIHKITNPDVEGKGYQNGCQKDFYNVKSYVLHRDNYACQSGQKVKHSKKLHVHHKKFRSDGGGDSPTNLITFCETCHNDVHAGRFVFKPKAKRAQTKHATEIGIIKSRLRQCGVEHQETFGYVTKFKREQQLHWPKTHANDAIAACLQDGELVCPMGDMLIKAHIAKGDYKQTSGKHSQLTVPTGKLFGLRKGDKVNTPRGVGFVKGKRSSGYFSIANLDGDILHASAKVAHCSRISARSTTQLEVISVKILYARRNAQATMASPSAPVLSGLNPGVSRSKE